MMRRRHWSMLGGAVIALAATLPALSQGAVHILNGNKVVDNSNPLPINVGSISIPPDVNIKDINGAVPSATNPMPAQLTNGTNNIDGTHPLPVSPTAAANAAANPFFHSQVVAGAVVSATNGNFTNPLQGNAVLSATNGLFSNILQGNTALSATNGVYANLLNGNAVLAATNPLWFRLSVDGTNAMDSTHGGYQNLLQGNAVLSATNGLFANPLQGNAVLSATNGLFSNILQGNAVLSATHGLFSNVLLGDAVPSATNPMASRISVDGTNYMDATHPIPISATAAANTAANPVNVAQSMGGTAVSATNPLAVRPSADGTNPVDSTHGLYTNLIQGNAAISQTNPVVVQNPGIAQASMLGVTTTIASSDTTISFGGTYHNVTIHTTSGASNIFVAPANGTATTNSYEIEGGASQTWLGCTMTGFHYIGSGTTGSLCYTAWFAALEAQVSQMLDSLDAIRDSEAAL